MEKIVFRQVTHVGIGNVVSHLYLRIYPQNVWMQADRAGLRETVLERKNKNANVFWTLAFFFVPKVGVPRGIRTGVDGVKAVLHAPTAIIFQ